MNFSFMMAVLVLGFLGTQGSVQASSVTAPVLRAHLTKLNLDENFPYKDTIVAAEIELSYPRHLVTLKLERKVICPSGLLCAQVMPEPLLIELPLIDQAIDSCGSKVVHALNDERPRDGSLQTISIRDNTGNRCPSFVARPATEVIYKTEYHGQGGWVRNHSTFEGEALHSQE